MGTEESSGRPRVTIAAANDDTDLEEFWAAIEEAIERSSVIRADGVRITLEVQPDLPIDGEETTGLDQAVVASADVGHHHGAGRQAHVPTNVLNLLDVEPGDRVVFVAHREGGIRIERGEPVPEGSP